MARQSNNEGHDGLDRQALKHAFLDWRVYYSAVMYLCLNVNLSSIGGFLPTIIRGLGYANAEVGSIFRQENLADIRYRTRLNYSLYPHTPWLL